MSSPETPPDRRVANALVRVAVGVMGLLTAGMMLVALEVLLDLFPSWPGGLRDVPLADLRTINQILPLCSSVLGVTFVATLLWRYRARGGLHLLIWAIGLACFAVGSITESIYGIFGWNAWAFRFWYLCGAVTIAAWMGQGTVHLLAPRRIAMATLAVLIAATAFASVRMLNARLDPLLITRSVVGIETINDGSERETLIGAAALLRPTTVGERGRPSPRRTTPLARAVLSAADEQQIRLPEADLESQLGSSISGTVAGHRVRLGALPRPLYGREYDTTAPALRPLRLGVWVDGEARGVILLEPAIHLSGHVITTPGVRILTPFFNLYGTATLIGGALYSAWIFWRRRLYPQRALGNLLIAAGAIVGGGGSAFARFGVLGHLYVIEMVSLILMFAGFLVATRRAAAAAASPAGDEAP